MLYKEARNSLLLEFERAYIKALLARSGGNLTQASQEAGVSRKYLYEIMKRCGVTPDGA
jgi:DNA-binding NtrC family response regulator